jgi:hypothetical protein
MKPALGVHLVLCVHCVCNQVGGTIHGLLGDGTDKVAIYVSGDRNARMAKQLAHHGDISDRGKGGGYDGYTGPRCYAPGGKTWKPC